MAQDQGAPRVPVSIGELIDKLTILDIKHARISDPGKRASVETERALLEQVLADLALPQAALSRHRHDLDQVNATLWDVEDDLRAHEVRQDFGADFVALARSVYRLNDQRAAIKLAANVEFGSQLVERKSYAGG